jgi:hypothetical protein
MFGLTRGGSAPVLPAQPIWYAIELRQSGLRGVS